MEILLNIWNQRNLSLKGKITIVKSLVLPQMQFLFSMINVSEDTLKEIDHILFEFIWGEKPEIYHNSRYKRWWSKNDRHL